jgi:hypothetical protein
MESLLLLTIIIVNFVMLALSKEGVLLNIFAIVFDFVAIFEAVSWFDYISIILFAILHSIVTVEKVLQ